MQAIILAAGMGRRLGEFSKENTKCMLPVGGVRLIDRMLDQLSELGLSRVVIVVGHKGQNVIGHVGNRYDSRLRIEWVENPIYDRTNNIYSLGLARDFLLQDDTLLLESDLIVDDRIFHEALSDPCPNVCMVAKYETWMDGTMMCIDKDNNIVNFVPKEAFRYEDTSRYYKTVNIYKFSKEFSANCYVPFLDAYLKALGNNEYYEQVLRVITLLNRSELKAHPIGDLPWYEIDDVHDRDVAESIFASGKERLSRFMSRYGGYWRFENLLDFCYLVNPYFPPRRMRDEMQANFDRLLTEYPSGMSVQSLLAGKFFNVRQEYIVLGNGAAELIKSLMENSKGRIGVVYPTFAEYPSRREEHQIVPFCPKGENFSYTADDLMAFFADKGLSQLLLINPDNPSGNFIPCCDVERLLSWCEERDITLVLDESFVDFSEDWNESSFLHNEMLGKHKGLVVVKSISKSFGVAGLRLGILASGNTELISFVKKDVSIWNINSFAEFFMQIFNKYEKDYKAACDKFQSTRKSFYDRLSRIPFLRVIPSQANFFLCEVCGPYTSAKLTEELLNRFNILIKDCDTKKGLQGKNMVRIAVRYEHENEALLSALESLTK